MMSAQMIIQDDGELAIDTNSPEGNKITITIPARTCEEIKKEPVNAANFH